jgi:hypothetical protein
MCRRICANLGDELTWGTVAISKYKARLLHLGVVPAIFWILNTLHHHCTSYMDRKMTDQTLKALQKGTDHGLLSCRLWWHPSIQFWCIISSQHTSAKCILLAGSLQQCLRVSGVQSWKSECQETARSLEGSPTSISSHYHLWRWEKKYHGSDFDKFRNNSECRRKA